MPPVSDDQIARINELSRLARERTLTEEEATERQALRRAYVDAVKASLRGTLENIRVVEEGEPGLAAEAAEAVVQAGHQAEGLEAEAQVEREAVGQAGREDGGREEGATPRPSTQP